MNTNIEKTKFKSGYVTIVGKPNVGKSTLINTILGEKVAIVSSVAGTTRFSITGVKNLPNAQIIFFDTPGIYYPKNELEKRMYQYAYNSIIDADIVLFLLNITEGLTDRDKKIFDRFVSILQENNKTLQDINIFCVFNKIDLVKDQTFIETQIDNVKKEMGFFKEYIQISALNKTNIELLLNKIVEYLPEREKLFEDDNVFKLPLKLHISEIIREKVFENVYQEIPRSTAVIVEEIKPGDVDKNKLVIEAYIIVERDNHKAIIIGENGQKLKKIGSQARQEIEQLVKRPVYLSLYVKVKEKWTKKADFVSQLF